MADIFQQTCFAFDCTLGEMALLEEAFQAASDLVMDFEPGDPSPEFLISFPPTADDSWAGFREIFSDPSFPTLGADLTGSNLANPCTVTAIVSAEMDFDPEAVAKLIQRSCATSLLAAPIGFEWSITCSRSRVGEFGGGWCAVFADRIEIEGTSDALARALSGGTI